MVYPSPFFVPYYVPNVNEIIPGLRLMLPAVQVDFQTAYLEQSRDGGFITTALSVLSTEPQSKLPPILLAAPSKVVSWLRLL